MAIRGRGRGAVVALVLALPALVPAIPRAAEPACVPSAQGSGFVTASGNRLMLNGCPWRAIGVNLWDMDAAKVLRGDLTGCTYIHPDLDAYFDASFGRIAERTHATAVRTFGFREQYTNGGLDFSSTDKLLHYAQKHNIRVIPVLGDQYATCGSPPKPPSWYHCAPGAPPGCVPGYKQPGHWGKSFREYVVAVSSRYKDHKAIAFWQIMNEALVDMVRTPDATALTDFSRDIVSAIRNEAGDTNHLVNLGTIGVWKDAGSQLPYYGELLACGPSSGGCNDLAEAHYYGADPLQGTPARSTIVADVVAWSPGGTPATLRSNATLNVDGWTVLTVIPGASHRHWALRLKGTAPRAWTASIDDVLVTSATSPQAHGFEGGIEGYTATNAALSTSATRPRTGLASLRAAVIDPASGLVEIRGPALTASASQISLAVRLNFSAPIAAPDGFTLAAYMHEALSVRGKPFVLGEGGLEAAQPGFSSRGESPELTGGYACGTRTTRTVAQRAAELSAVMDVQLDDEHRSSGFLVWDWKDPEMLATKPDGSRILDPTISCRSMTPSDPLTLVLRRWADATPSAKLPAPAPLPATWPAAFQALQGPPPVVALGTTITVQARMSRGGNAMRGITILASGACSGQGVTDALGNASFACKLTQPGVVSVTLAPSSSSCGCSLPGRTYTVTVQ